MSRASPSSATGSGCGVLRNFHQELAKPLDVFLCTDDLVVAAARLSLADLLPRQAWPASRQDEDFFSSDLRVRRDVASKRPAPALHGEPSPGFLGGLRGRSTGRAVRRGGGALQGRRWAARLLSDRGAASSRRSARMITSRRRRRPYEPASEPYTSPPSTREELMAGGTTAAGPSTVPPRASRVDPTRRWRPRHAVAATLTHTAPAAPRERRSSRRVDRRRPERRAIAATP